MDSCETSGTCERPVERTARPSSGEVRHCGDHVLRNSPHCRSAFHESFVLRDRRTKTNPASVGLSCSQSDQDSNEKWICLTASCIVSRTKDRKPAMSCRGNRLLCLCFASARRCHPNGPECWLCPTRVKQETGRQKPNAAPILLQNNNRAQEKSQFPSRCG